MDAIGNDILNFSTKISGLKAKIGQESILIHDESILIHDESILIHDEPILIHDESILIHDESILIHDESILIRDEPILIRDEPILIHDEPILIHDEPILIRDESILVGNGFLGHFAMTTNRIGTSVGARRLCQSIRPVVGGLPAPTSFSPLFVLCTISIISNSAFCGTLGADSRTLMAKKEIIQQ